MSETQLTKAQTEAVEDLTGHKGLRGTVTTGYFLVPGQDGEPPQRVLCDPIDAFLVSVQHTGTRYLNTCLSDGYGSWAMTDKGKIDSRPEGRGILHTHLGTQTVGRIRRLKKLPVVIPLRHPARVATSWKYYGSPASGDWLERWKLMDLFPDAFFFPMESKPFTRLDAYLGREVTRKEGIIGSIGPYPEKKSMVSMQQYLEDQWAEVEEALATEVGRRFYDV
jgi:hypothetical protein